MKPKTLVFLLMSLAATASHAQHFYDTLPEINNYAWGFALATGEPASFYQLELPLLVYQSSDDKRLRDVSVFNAASQAVPRVVEPAATTTEELEARHPLPFAALFLNQEPDADRVRMMFEQMGGETRIEVQSNKATDEKIRPPISGYIVDTRSLEGNVDALELDWPRPIAGFVGRVTVSGSNDLEKWTLLGGAALADLQEAEAQILQRRVALADKDFDFLRLTWSGLPDSWRLDGLTAVQVTAAPQQSRRTLMLDSVGRDETDDGVIFDAGGPIPVDRVGLALPDQNVVLSAVIWHWLPARELWVRAHGGAFYQLRRDNVPMSSKPAPIKTVRAARWKVTIAKGHPDTQFKLELGWRPDTLLFVAQGEAPFTLATGRAQAANENFPEDRLLGDVSLGRIATDNGPVDAAVLGERFALAGVEREAPPKPINWQTILLWAGLIIAVLFVLWMALRVLRGVAAD